jgi:hypothetical protein
MLRQLKEQLGASLLQGTQPIVKPQLLMGDLGKVFAVATACR